MRQFLGRASAVAAIILLAACSAEVEEPPEEALPNEADQSVVVVEDTDVTNPDGFAIQPPVDAGTAEVIPVGIRGSWGINDADCEPGRADAKGLLVIDDTSLEFYESVGTLSQIAEMEDSRIRGSFDFTGEGMNWQRDVMLDVQDGGSTLVRREYGDGAASGPFRYARCP